MFSAVNLASVAVGLGVTLALALLYRQTISPPFELDTEGLVEVLATSPGGLDETWAFQELQTLARETRLMQVSGWAVGDGTLRAPNGDGSERVSVAYVSPNYFEILGVEAGRGRVLALDDGQAEDVVPAVVRYTTWRDRLGEDQDIVGRVLMVNRRPHVVVGVAPQEFTRHRAGPRPDLWVPLSGHPLMRPDAASRFDQNDQWIRILARTTDGVSIAQANAAVRSAVAGISSVVVEGQDRSALVLPYAWQGARSSGDAKIIGGMFMALATVILLVVALNLTGMGFVRSATRERELAIRLALGSGRTHLVRLLMAESVLLSVGGGALVIAVLWASLETFSWRLGSPLPVSLRVDSAMIVLCLSAALAMTLLFGLIPALRYSDPDMAASLKDGAATAARRPGRVHRSAATLQVAFAVPALIVAGGVSQGAMSMSLADFGVTAENLLVGEPSDLAADGYGLEEAQAFAQTLRDELATLAGVEAAAISDGSPLDGQRRRVHVGLGNGPSPVEARLTRVDGEYLAALEVPVLRGRGFTNEDRPGAEPVAMLTQSLVDRLFPGMDPLGRRVAVHGWGDPTAAKDGEGSFTVIGVTGNVAGAFLESSTDNIFVSYWQNPVTNLASIVRATGPNTGLADAIRGVAAALDPELGRPPVRTFDQLVVARGADMPVWSVLFGVIAALLTALSAVGIFGVVAFAVTNRRREIGVRMSLGSTRGQVLTLVMGDAIRLAAPGLILGSVLGIFIGRRVLNQMYVDIGLPMTDVRIFIGASILALTVVALASAAPARQAASIDPLEALRAD